MQDLDSFAQGIENILVTQKRVAEHYFSDGSVEAAIPPLKALLHIMREGRFEGKDIHDAGVRALFTRDSVLKSPWYAERLKQKQKIEINTLKRYEASLSRSLSGPPLIDESFRKELELRQAAIQKELKHAQSPDYLKSLFGTIGADTALWQGSGIHH